MADNDTQLDNTDQQTTTTVTGAGATSSSTTSNNRVADLFSTHAEAGKDPLSKLLEIVRSDIDDYYKQQLILIHQNRFRHRRRMAYMSLACLIIIFIVVIIGIWNDGMYVCDPNKVICRKGILTVMEENNTLIIWVAGFFTSIIGTYFGVSAWRPAS